MILANGKGRVSTLAVDDDLDMKGRNVTNVGVVSVNDHVTLVGARLPGKGFRHVERDGWSLDQDEERSFWKDDFSVDSSSEYDVIFGSSGSHSYDIDHITVPSGTGIQLNRGDPAPKKFSMTVKQTGVTGIMGNGTNQLQIRFTGAPANVITYNSLLVRYFNSGANNNTIQFECRTNNGDMIGSGFHIFADTAAYHAFLNSKWTIDITFNPDSRINVSIPELNLNIITSDPVSSIGHVRPYITTYSLKAPLEIYEITSSSSISYSDDFSTDTVTGANGRYQAITGSNAYDDVNKQMTVTAEAGDTAKTRLKSYKQLEGSYKKKLHLPASGTDGDVVAAYFGTEPTLTSGFGVGAIRTGGAWNIATIDGKTVTDTGTVITDLADGDSFYVEVERDTRHGVVWYYVYGETKPTAASGKLFNVHQEVYDGVWFKNNSVTENSIAVSEIEDRAQSIVGYTNCTREVPYHVRDEFTEDSLGRYPHHPVWSISNGILICSIGSGLPIWFTNKQISNFDVTFDFKPQLTDGTDGNRKFWFAFGSNRNVIEGYNKGIRYLLRFQCRTSSTLCVLDKFDVTLQKDLHSFGSTTDILEGQEGFTSVRILLVNGVLSLYINGVQLGTTYNIGENVVGYIGAYGWATTDEYEIDNLDISGTAIEYEPMLRGSSIGKFHDGTQEVACTRFVDDCQWDTSGEYASLRGTWVHDLVNGNIACESLSYGRAYILNSIQTRDFILDVELCANTAGILICSDGLLNSDDVYKPLNGIIIIPGSSLPGEYVNGSQVKPYNIPSLPDETSWHNLRIICSVSLNTISVYHDGIEIYTTIIQTPTLYDKIGLYAYGGLHIPKFRNLQINALSADSTNGIAACIPSVPHGGRYGVQESVYFNIQNAVKHGEYAAVVSAKSILPGEMVVSAENTTDSTSVRPDGIIDEDVTTSTEYDDHVVPVVLSRKDKDDTIKIGVKCKNDETLYVDTLAVVPKYEVI